MITGEKKLRIQRRIEQLCIGEQATFHDLSVLTFTERCGEIVYRSGPAPHSPVGKYCRFRGKKLAIPRTVEFIVQHCAIDLEHYTKPLDELWRERPPASRDELKF